MAKYHNPKTGKTVEAKNLNEALQKMAPKVTKKPTSKKKVSEVSETTKDEE